MSDNFHVYSEEARRLADAWRSQKDGSVSALDKKTECLATLAALSALRHEGNLKSYVTAARDAGASRDEVASAVLVGIFAPGNVVARILAIAMLAYDSPLGSETPKRGVPNNAV